eukprot:TRINITY_DN3439_c0_g5_i2.p1 TRINITY_DN3439_c0_g5~~TRINITY_DN3439_c0_g5_i2.p1  ORF type:complete len:432 (+),score=191.00 TRINITY_DN3439_c0_g5_i2:168-1298(+)
MDFREVEDYFSDLAHPTGLAKLRKHVFDHSLSPFFRSWNWKLFLGVLSVPFETERWVEETNKRRQEYSKSVAELSLSDPNNSELDPNINNPLSQQPESAWVKYFENETLEKEISQDINRTYPGNEFFERPTIRSMMTNILFVFAKQNPNVGYKQGMHELLAPIIYILQQDYLSVKTLIQLSSSLEEAKHKQKERRGEKEEREKELLKELTKEEENKETKKEKEDKVLEEEKERKGENAKEEGEGNGVNEAILAQEKEEEIRGGDAKTPEKKCGEGEAEGEGEKKEKQEGEEGEKEKDGGKEEEIKKEGENNAEKKEESSSPSSPSPSSPSSPSPSSPSPWPSPSPSTASLSLLISLLRLWCLLRSSSSSSSPPLPS